jgi:hypothetical protein
LPAQPPLHRSPAPPTTASMFVNNNNDNDNNNDNVDRHGRNQGKFSNIFY